MSNYIKNIESSFIIQIVKICFGFVTSVLAARALGAQGQGYVSYVILIFSLLGSYGNIGIDNDAVTYIQKKSGYAEHVVYSVNITYLLFVWLVISFAVILLKISNVFLKDYSMYFILLGLMITLFIFIMNCVNAIYIGNEKIKEVNKYILISTFIKFFGIIILYLSKLLNIYTLFFIQAENIVFSSILLVKNSNIKFKLMVNKCLLFKELKYGCSMYFSSLFIYLNYRVDQLMIKDIKGTADLGIYTVAVTLAELVFLIPQSVTNALMGRLYNVKFDDKKNITSNAVKFTFYICLMLCIVGCFMADLIPIVYGKQYYRAVKAVIILFIGIVFASIGKTAYPYFITEGKPKVHLCITFLTLLVNIIFNYILIPSKGINGAAAASSISYTFYGMMYVFYFICKEKFKFKQMFILNKNDKKIIKKLIIKNYKDHI